MSRSDREAAAPAFATELAPTARDVARLEESFRAFTKTTRDLEAAYDKLTRRAGRIDVELGRTNAELRDKVDELERLSRLQTGILDALPVGVVVIDGAGHVAAVNVAAQRMLGRSAVEIVGRARDAIVGSDGGALLLRDAAQAERDVTMLDGSRRHIAWTVAPLADGGELQVLTDRTVATRLREQVSRLDTLAALGEMAAGVAHEIRNPLNGIEGFAGLLERSLAAGEDDRTRWVDRIRRGVKEVNAIIGNLLTFATPEQVRGGSLDLAALLAEVVSDAVDRNGGPVVDLDLPSPLARRTAALAGDRLKLKIAFTNLVKNACEAAGTGGHVALIARDAGRGVEITVLDDGPGLSPRMRERLFRPFSTGKPEGTGLGLAIAHRIVTLHGGEIEHVQVKQGCAFRVVLPYRVEER